MARSDNGNLRRGNIDPEKERAWRDRGLVPQPQGGAIHPPEAPGNIEENAAKFRAERKATRDRVGASPDAALEEISKDLTSLTKRIVHRAEREGKVPPKATMEVIKEFRQTQEAVNEARRARGDVAEFEEWAASVDARVAEATSRMASGPAPAVEVPA